jgi:UDP-N-acetyl-2-amino-2-deoxyglucuronate dehydrogenase
MNDVTPLRFVLMGCSKVAGKHAVALRRISDASLVGVCDINAERAESFGREYGVPHFTDKARLFESVPCEAVIISTPSGDHAARVLDVVQYGKHIIVEKPMALRLEDADAVIRACDEAGVKLFVVKQNRYNRPIQAMRKALEEGRFGKLVLGSVRVFWCRPQGYYAEAPWRGTWALDGGVLTNQASHHIDMLEWFMGDVESVSAMCATRLAKIETEDVGVATLRFKNGALGVIEATTATRPKDLEGSITILGEKGTVQVGGFAMDKLVTWSFAEPCPEDAQLLQTHSENPKEFAWNHEAYLRGVIGSIRTGQKALVDGLEGRKSLELINALYESAETGREVPLRFRPKVCRLGVKRVGHS